MNALIFVPVLRDQNARTKNQTPAQLIPPIRRTLDRVATFALRLGDGGHLASEHVESNDSIPEFVSGDSSVVALLHGGANGPTPSWILIACSSRLGLNDQTPTFPLAAIELGDLLTIGERSWLVASLWQPELVNAPAELRDKPCPVCGGELGFASVVRCACGRWSHLEDPGAPDDRNTLNCFLRAGMCGECGRRASLEPQIIPDVPMSLKDAELDADD